MTDDQREAYEERAGILEFCAGMSREDEMVTKKPPGGGCFGESVSYLQSNSVKRFSGICRNGYRHGYSVKLLTVESRQCIFGRIGKLEW